MDSAAHQQPVPRQSLHADAGAERALSSEEKDRRRDFPDVPGLGRDPSGHRWPGDSADRCSSRFGQRLVPVICVLFDYRMALIAIAAVARELHTGAGVRHGRCAPPSSREREAAAARNHAHRGDARVDQSGQGVRHRSRRDGAIRARQLGRVPRRAPSAPDAGALPRRQRTRFAGSRTCRRMYVGARQVMAGGSSGLGDVAVSLGLFQGSIALVARVSARNDHRPMGQPAGRGRRDLARARDAASRRPSSVGSGHAIPPKPAPRSIGSSSQFRLRSALAGAGTVSVLRRGPARLPRWRARAAPARARSSR